jgi:hypothetical protein
MTVTTGVVTSLLTTIRLYAETMGSYIHREASLWSRVLLRKKWYNAKRTHKTPQSVKP